jgi:soluble lytic murein transglycosylase-like protein
MFKRYRQEAIKNKIYYLSGKYYPSVVKAIYNYVEPKFDNVIISIIWQESKFKKHALSKKYWGGYRDYGLMQISDYFWKFDKKFIFDEDYNIVIGYRIYKKLWKQSNYNLWYSLKYYNGTSIYAHEVMNIYSNLIVKFGEKNVYS